MKKDTEKGLLIGLAVGAAAGAVVSSKKVRDVAGRLVNKSGDTIKHNAETAKIEAAEAGRAVKRKAAKTKSATKSAPGSSATTISRGRSPSSRRQSK